MIRTVVAFAAGLAIATTSGADATKPTIDRSARSQIALLQRELADTTARINGRFDSCTGARIPIYVANDGTLHYSYTSTTDQYLLPVVSEQTC